MNALHSLFTGLLYFVILLHPRGTIYCFRPKSPSTHKRKKTPPSSPLLSSSWMPSSSSSSSSSSSAATNTSKASFFTMKKRSLFSKHMKHDMHSPHSSPTPSHQHGPYFYPASPGHIPKENLSNFCSIPHSPTTNEVSHERTSYKYPTETWATKNVVSELEQNDFAMGVVQKMFAKGWTQNGRVPPRVHKVLKVNHTSESLEGFEMYRRTVKTRATIGIEDGRLSFDGNEVLRYWCSDLPDTPAHLKATKKEILLSDNGRRALEKMHEDGVEGDSLTRAMFICRVIAGRVARQKTGGGIVDLEAGQFDSLVDGQDFLVLDPRAVLPCFIVIFDDDDGDNEDDEAEFWSGKLESPTTCSLSWYKRLIN